MSEVKLGRSIIMENKTLQAVLSAAIAAFYGVHGCACRADIESDNLTKEVVSFIEEY